MRTAGRIAAISLAAATLGVGVGSSAAAACPGANPCPYTSIANTFGRAGTSFFNVQPGVAVDSAGNQYLTDWNNNRIIKFSSSGAFAWAVGANNASGQSGTGSGQFNHPYELRVSNDGLHVYIADGFDNRVEELNTSDGSPVRMWGRNGGDGSAGSGVGEFNRPVGIGIDSTGNVYVSDCLNNRVQEFDSGGNFIAQFGSAGYGNGQFNCPVGVAIDSGGNVYVADSNNSRIQKFGPSPTFTYAAQTTVGLLNLPYGEKFDGGGNLWVADAGHNQVQRINPTTLASTASFGGLGTGNGQFNFPEDVAVDPGGSIHVADNNNSREQKLDTSGNYQAKIVSPEFPNNDPRFNGPTRAAASPDGYVWMADSSNNRVLKLDPASGTIVAKAGANHGDGAVGGGSGSGQLNFPAGVAVDSAGNVYVADVSNNRIDEFNSSGTFVETIGWGVSDGANQLEVCTSSCQLGLAGTGNGQFHGPQGVALDSSGDLYVADSGNCRVQELTISPGAATFVTRWGRQGGAGVCGSGPAQFSNPVDVQLDGAGHVWVTDENTAQIQKFTPSGGYLATVGGPGTSGGTFDTPQETAFDPAGDMLVADTFNDRVQLLNSTDGSFGFAWGGPPAGVTPGPGEIGETGGVAVLPGGRVAVPDENQNRMQIFSFTAPVASAASSTPASTHAALAATVDPAGGVAAYHFEWGPTSAYGAITPTAATGPTSTAQPVGATISPLLPSTAYHWRLVASNPAGISATGDQILTTTPFGTGPTGGEGAAGGQGSTGGGGPAGGSGPNGGPGTNGPQGAQGAAGPAGQPGRNAVVTCVGKRVGSKVAVRCTLTLKLPAHDHVWVRLARAGRVFATGHLITRRAGIRKVPLKVLSAPTHGRYRLTVLLAAAHSHARSFTWTVRL